MIAIAVGQEIDQQLNQTAVLASCFEMVRRPRSCSLHQRRSALTSSRTCRTTCSRRRPRISASWQTVRSAWAQRPRIRRRSRCAAVRRRLTSVIIGQHQAIWKNWALVLLTLSLGVLRRCYSFRKNLVFASKCPDNRWSRGNTPVLQACTCLEKTVAVFERPR